MRGPAVLPGHLHDIQRSLDLDSWEIIGSRWTGTLEGRIGGIDFTDPDAPDGRAFYRAVPVE